MFKNYFLLFIRNLKRQRLFSAINLLGLTISIVSTLLIYLYVRKELSFDRFHHDAERIYRVNQTFIWGEDSQAEFSSTGPGVAHALKEELPEIELITSIHTPGNFIVSYTNPSQDVISFEENKVLAGDSNFFRMFNFPVIKGNPETALMQANTLVMTESTATKYFGTENPIGKLLRLGLGDRQQTYEVTGVIQDTPENSYIEFDVLLSIKSFPQIEKIYWSWIWTQLETYVKLSKTANVEETRAKLVTIPRIHAEETLQRVMNVSYDEYVKSGKKWELFLQPLTTIHLPTKLIINRLNDSGDIKIVYAMTGIAIFIVLLSCVNFMNLSTAQFTRRIKEASIRKVLGLGKKELGVSYFVEALIFCLIALIAGLMLTEIILPVFNVVAGDNLEVNLFSDPELMLTLCGLVLFMAATSSIYPALFLSAFNPVEGIKGKLKSGNHGKNFRNGLVIFQFSVSIILIICTAIVFQQLNYVGKKNIGFNKENLMVLDNPDHASYIAALADAARNVSGVTEVTTTTSMPPNLRDGDKFTAEGMNAQTFSLNYVNADEHFIPTLDIKLKLGRNFSADMPADSDRVIVNESTLKRMGWPLDESSIGRKIEQPWEGGKKFEVIGVVSDFNYWSLAVDIEPMAIFNINNQDVSTNDKKYIVLRIKAQQGDAWNNTLSQLHDRWKTFAGESPFQYSFVDQAFAATFETQEYFGKALSVLAGLAILIASLGLLGMIIYTLEQRTKEIGIRKVSGASVWNILTLISKGYTKLIVIAFMIGAPLAYYMMNNWLQDFSDHITPSYLIFILSGMGTLFIAVLITSYHAAKAALTNPVDVLKDE